MPKPGAALSLSTPAGCPAFTVMSAIAPWMLSRPPCTDCKNRSPASLSVRPRVLRWNRRTPRLRSSWATLRLTAAGVSASRRAADEKLPVSALRTKDSRLARVSIAADFNKCLKVIQDSPDYCYGLRIPKVEPGKTILRTSLQGKPNENRHHRRRRNRLRHRSPTRTQRHRRRHRQQPRPANASTI